MSHEVLSDLDLLLLAEMPVHIKGKGKAFPCLDKVDCQVAKILNAMREAPTKHNETGEREMTEDEIVSQRIHDPPPFTLGRKVNIHPISIFSILSLETSATTA